VPRWAAFAALALAVLAFVLFSARASQRVVTDLAAERRPRPHAGERPDADHPDATGRPDTGSGPEEPSSMALLANVGISHALFASVLVAGVWITDVPPAALGIGVGATGVAAVGIGIGVGAGIAAVNTLLGSLIEADPGAALRALLTPESTSGWIVLLAVVLPVIAGFEELLFRAILIGGFSAGFGISPWLLSIGASAAFAAGHGAQGRLGIAVTGALGLVLAAVFVATESLLIVVVAHYVINAVEFVLGGIGYDPLEPARS
jgi:membrane protease YdiL (CAAX protease family)